MGGVLPWEQDALRKFELTPALHSLEQVKAIREAVSPRGIEAGNRG